jgi:hypothetical protein
VAPPAMDSDMEPICGPPLAAGDHRYPEPRDAAAARFRTLVGFLGISDEQVLGLLSLSLHPRRLLSLSIAGGTDPTRSGREAGSQWAQAVSHSEERIATGPCGDNQRDPIVPMRPVYIACVGRSMTCGDTAR